MARDAPAPSTGNLRTYASNRLAANNLIEGSHDRTLALPEEFRCHRAAAGRRPWHDDGTGVLLRSRPRP